MLDIEIPTLTLLFFAGGFAGFVDSIAGGGGIITVPVLLAVGIPPHHALATNKLQSSFGSLTATMNYARKGLMNPRDLLTGILFSFLGGIAGSIMVQYFSPGFLEKMILVMLIILFIYTAMSPKLGFEQTQHKLNHLFFYTLFVSVDWFLRWILWPGNRKFLDNCNNITLRT